MGFWQLPTSEETAKILTFVTSFGRYCFKRLPFGISSAPKEFHGTLTEILTGLEGVLIYIDDVLIFGKDRAEHNHEYRLYLKDFFRLDFPLICQNAFGDKKKLNFWVTTLKMAPFPQTKTQFNR